MEWVKRFDKRVDGMKYMEESEQNAYGEGRKAGWSGWAREESRMDGMTGEVRWS